MSFKAQELAEALVDELKKRSTLALLQGVDSNGDPTIRLGDGVAGHKNFFIRVKAVSDTLSKDALGLTQTVFTPHVIQFATEENYAGVNDNIADILVPAELLPVIGLIVLKGAAVEWYTSANGVAPVVGTLVVANLKASFSPDLYWGILSQS